MHREEREFSVVFHLSAEFDDAYEGEQDGFAWHEKFEQVLKPRLLAAVFEVLQSEPEWKILAAPRGRDPERSLEFDLIHKPSA